MTAVPSLIALFFLAVALILVILASARASAGEPRLGRWDTTIFWILLLCPFAFFVYGDEYAALMLALAAGASVAASAASACLLIDTRSTDTPTSHLLIRGIVPVAFVAIGSALLAAAVGVLVSHPSATGQFLLVVFGAPGASSIPWLLFRKSHPTVFAAYFGLCAVSIGVSPALSAWSSEAVYGRHASEFIRDVAAWSSVGWLAFLGLAIGSFLLRRAGASAQSANSTRSTDDDAP